jgi:hypothetical protein
MLVMLASASVVRMELQFHPDYKYLLRVHSVEILLMVDSGPVRNI